MKVVIAIDSFKGSMTSMEAGNAAREGIKRAYISGKCPEIVVKPLADGGEGTTVSLIEGLGGSLKTIKVHGPLGDFVEATYGVLKDNRTAVIEMAEAAGITLIGENEKNPWKASTFGVGEMLVDAIKSGCRDFIVGIGGSATTEGGVGMLSALGFEFLDSNGNVLPAEFSSLNKIADINDAKVIKELKECSFRVACDVKNPLCGKNGAIYIYGPQKGVKEDELEKMDGILGSYKDAVFKYTKKDLSIVEGTGAAGGLGFAFLSFIPNVCLQSGIDIVIDAIALEKEIENADIVITGEGCLDGQTANGKVPVGVARLAKSYGAKVLAFAGSLTEDARRNNESGIDAFFSIINNCCSLEEAMNKEAAIKNMTNTVEQVFRAI